MTNKLTLSARKAVFNAQQEARSRGSKAVEPEHLLLGILSQPDSVACYVLNRLNVDMIEMWDSVETSLVSGRGGLVEVEMSTASDSVIETANQAMSELRDLFVGSEHLLMGLTRVKSRARDLLATAGIDAARLTSEIAHLQEAPQPYLVSDDSVVGETPISRIAHQILQEGLQESVDEIQIEPVDDDVRVGMLAHGAVSEAMTVPRHIVHPLMSRFRSMINMKPPQGSGADGTIRLTYRDTEHDLIVTLDRVELGDRLRMRLVACPGLEAIPAETTPGPVAYSTVPSQRMAPPSGPSALADVLSIHALRGRDVLGIEHLTTQEILLILDVATRLKQGKFDATQTQFAQGQTLAMLFEKPSLRTRVTFEAGMTQLGGHAIYLEGRLGLRESVPDVAKNLDRWIDGIMARTFAHQTVVDLAENAKIPVINGLSDREHPCQALADLQTIGERKGRLKGLKLAYVGDGNNVAQSLVLIAAKLGVHFAIACPAGYEMSDDIWKAAEAAASDTGSRLTMTHDPIEAVATADAVYTDVWASMGQEDEASEREKVFAAYQLNSELLGAAKAEAIVMHCLPAHRGVEITDEVLDGPQSVVFDQAENRLHAQKAVLSLVL